MIRSLPLILVTFASAALISRPFALADAAAATQAPTGAQVHASFHPAHPGASTTIVISFHVGAQDTMSLSPLTGVEVRLPAGVTSGLDTLGMATCTQQTLQLKGPGACSPNSVMGRGSATVAVAFGSEIVNERVAVTIFMAPAVDDRTTLLFYASGTTPVISQNIFRGFLLSDTGLFGARLEAMLPLVAGLPGSPDVAIMSMRTAIGPKGLKYYKQVHGVTVAYTPRGFEVPASCPKRGFLVSVRLGFADGRGETTSNRIPCPTPVAHSAQILYQRDLAASVSDAVAVRETARLHLVSHRGSTLLNETGKGSGSFRCPIMASLNTAADMSTAYTKATLIFTIACGSNNTISGRGTTSYYASGSVAHFSGDLSVTGGTGRYTHVSGSDFKVSGVIQRSSYALTFSVNGTMRN